MPNSVEAPAFTHGVRHKQGLIKEEGERENKWGNMAVIISNVSWMGFNVLLALVAVLVAQFIRHTSHKALQLLFGGVWLLFLPNTLYLLTDVIHFFENIDDVSGSYRLLLMVQYVILLALGLVTYVAAVSPVESAFAQGVRWKRIAFILAINLLVGCGMTLGRVERINSWDVVVHTRVVLHTGVHLFTSPPSLLLVLLFALIGSVTYVAYSTVVQRVPLLARKSDPR